MRRRPDRAVASGLVALSLLAISVLGSVMLIQNITGAADVVVYDRIAQLLRERVWGDGWVAGFGGAAILVGLVLLGAAIVPGRAAVVPLAATDEIVAGVTRRSLLGALRGTAHSVTGVGSARIILYRRRIRVTVRSRRSSSDAVAEAVRAAVAARLARLGPQYTPRVSARVRGFRSAR